MLLKLYMSFISTILKECVFVLTNVCLSFVILCCPQSHSLSDFFLSQVMDPNLAQLWFSGKEMARGKTLANYLGKNEKTKVIIKLQKKGTVEDVKQLNA